MDQKRLQESTAKATMKPLELTRSAMEHTQKALDKTQGLSRTAAEKSKKLRMPSAKADKIGTAVGGIAGVGLLLGGTVQLCIGKPVYAAGTLIVGAAALLSNRIHYYQMKGKNRDMGQGYPENLF